jgi:hypothetical protein
VRGRIRQGLQTVMLNKISTATPTIAIQEAQRNNRIFFRSPNIPAAMTARTIRPMSIPAAGRANSGSKQSESACIERLPLVTGEIRQEPDQPDADRHHWHHLVRQRFQVLEGLDLAAVDWYQHAEESNECDDAQSGLQNS